MKTITVVPLIGFSGITFGMSRKEVRRHLGEYHEFKKCATEAETSDDFGFCHVFYDAQGLCEAAEFFSDVEVKIGDKTFLPGKIDTAMAFFKDLHEEQGSFISRQNSVGITICGDGTVESILFGVQNYYK